MLNKISQKASFEAEIHLPPAPTSCKIQNQEKNHLLERNALLYVSE